MQMQVVSEYGTTIPWVARIGIQGTDILGFCQVDDQKKAEANGALMRLHERMVPLQRTKDEIAGKVEEGFQEYASKGTNFNWGLPIQKIPSVPNLLSLGEGFLQSAKIAIAATTDVIGVFYGTQFDHRFDKVVKWAEQQFGADDYFTQNAKLCEAFVKQLLKFRDAIEHPASGRFFVTNIQIAQHEGRWLFGRPGWGIEGVVHTDILADMETIIERIVEISEIFVIELFFKLKYPQFPMHIEEIPEDQRRPECPIRYRAIPSFAPPDIDAR